MTKKAFSFEQAIEELQTIVTAMEAGNVSLDESLGLYERGVELVRLCNQRLDICLMFFFLYFIVALVFASIFISP